MIITHEKVHNKNLFHVCQSNNVWQYVQAYRMSSTSEHLASLLSSPSQKLKTYDYIKIIFNIRTCQNSNKTR